MKIGYYPRLAWDGIRKNRRLYLPYLLACIGTVTMYYIVYYLCVTPTLKGIRFFTTVQLTLHLGSWVIAVFAAFFLFYTHAFLMRRRKKEFGLYNMLGMDKRNIARVLFFETLTVALLSVAGGLVSGIVFSKLAELALLRLLGADVNYTLAVPGDAVVMTLAVFGVIFLLLFLNALRQIGRVEAVKLFRSENAGEKPPRVNWVLGAAGAVILIAAYYMAVSIQEPLSALMWFFVAVVMVILGTYLLFIAGSVMVCRLLQKNKQYYYQPSHFVSVSSMAYRMKRNGAGLASICILVTMVLVMLSSTTALYFGADDSVTRRYPRQLTFQVIPRSSVPEDFEDDLRRGFEEAAERNGTEMCNLLDYHSIAVAGKMENGVLYADPTSIDLSLDVYKDVVRLCFVDLEGFNRSVGADYTLAPGEALTYGTRAPAAGETVSVQNGPSFTIARVLDAFFPDGEAASMVVPTVYLVVADLQGTAFALNRALTGQTDETRPLLSWTCSFDTTLNTADQLTLKNDMEAASRNVLHALDSFSGTTHLESYAENWSDYLGTFAGLFFLGVLLSLVFILAAVLIIYYKQVSEGYEDQARFTIMRNVGMTGKEIRKSINSQLLTVFFLPLLFAGLHLAFAFPMIYKLLLLFQLNNLTLFTLTTVGSYLLFAVFYALVYKGTSNVYYSIVSGARERQK